MALKTRQLDFSPLDNRSYIYNERARREQAMSSFAETLTGYFLDRGKEKRLAQRQKQKDIAEGLSFDTNITSNYIIDKKIAEYWENEIKTPWLKVMQQKKGGITGIDKSTLDAQKQSLVRMANAGKAFVKNIENMKTMMAKPANKGLYQYDFDEVQRTLQDLDQGVISLEDFVTTNFAENYDTGLSFVNLEPIDPTQFEMAGLRAFKKNTGKAGKDTEIESMVGGKKVTRTAKETLYGSYDQFADEMIAGINARKGDNANIIKFIGQELTDKEKQAATEVFPEQDIEGQMLSYYYKEKRRPELESQLDPYVEKGYKEAVITPSAADARKKEELTITPSADKWDFRSKAVKLTGPIEYVEDGKEKESPEMGAYATRLEYGKIPGTDKTGLFASVLIPSKGQSITVDEAGNLKVSGKGEAREVYVEYDKIKDSLKKFNFEDIEEYEGKEGSLGKGFWEE